MPNNLAVAPMAGVTDRPFRQLCRRLGAGYAVSEMVASNPKLWGTDKSRRRIDHAGEPAPIAVQIAGADPAMMAEAARYNVARGAQIIDINMGCPAKKVCNAAAGSALLVERAAGRGDRAKPSCARSTCRSRSRSAPDRIRRIATRLRIASIAQAAGIAALTVHGRTPGVRCSSARSSTTRSRAVKRAVSIPVIANGDIDYAAEGARRARAHRRRTRS